MAKKITKERVESTLNDVIDLARDLFKQCDPMQYSSADAMKNAREAVNSLKWLAEGVLNKENKPEVAQLESKYISIQLKKSIGNMSAELFQKATEGMKKEVLHK